MTVQFTDPATALAHIEAYMNGGDELGIVPEADAVAALAYLRQSLAPATDARLAEIEAELQGNYSEYNLCGISDAMMLRGYVVTLLSELKRLRAPQPVTEPATVAAAVEAALRQLYIAVGQYGMRLNGPEEKEAALRNAGRVLAALANSKDSQSENGKDKK